MTKHKWSIYTILGSIVILSTVNVIWLRIPKSIPLGILVVVNLVCGLVFIVSLFRFALVLVQKYDPSSLRPIVRPLLSLGLSLLLANAIALYVCDFHLCFLIIFLNIAVPVGWFLGRQVMVRNIATRKDG
jgi:hypothetical protein